MSQLETQILHQDYVLTCPDGQEAQLLEAVERVEQQFEQMRDKSKLRSRERIGVLLAVNLAYENLELRKQLQALQEQLAHAQSTDGQDDAELEAADDAHSHFIGLDSERIAQLEHIAAQYATDLVMAQQLIQRLDDVLVLQAAETALAPPEAEHEAAATHIETELPATLQLALTDAAHQAASTPSTSADRLASTTDLDDHSSMDLLPSSAETR